ncbi:MAG: hypothetical protein KGL39_49845 [Patescibacteria group bacterium]|nr:hypothetical protein [Patescibacteria group bacterium]
MTVVIKAIPHNSQRYDTCGDWQLPNPQTLLIDVSGELPFDSQFLVAIHEFIEAYLCAKKNITQAEVDAFDKNFKGGGEPGDQPTAPYHEQHIIATGIEMFLCAYLGLHWQDHEKAINSLTYDPPQKSL